jgi:hypothetical protein
MNKYAANEVRFYIFTHTPNIPGLICKYLNAKIYRCFHFLFVYLIKNGDNYTYD